MDRSIKTILRSLLSREIARLVESKMADVTKEAHKYSYAGADEYLNALAAALAELT